MDSSPPFVPVISSREVESALNYADLIPMVEHALADFSRGAEGGVVQPPRTVFRIEEHSGVFFAMPCYSRDQETLTCKLLTRFPPPQEGAPTVPGIRTITALFSPRTGSLEAILESESITSMRTAAASAVATKYLAPEGSKILAILGAGRQAEAHVDALRQVIKFTEVRVWNRTHQRAADFAARHGCLASPTVEAAVGGADVITTVTSSHTPILQNCWVKRGAHINCVGAVRANQQELDPELVRRCVIYTDSTETAVKESGDIIESKAQIFGEIGAVSLGRLEARRNETTIFKSMGMAVEDAVAGKHVYDQLYGHQTKQTCTKGANSDQWQS